MYIKAPIHLQKSKHVMQVFDMVFIHTGANFQRFKQCPCFLEACHVKNNSGALHRLSCKQPRTDRSYNSCLWVLVLWGQI